MRKVLQIALGVVTSIGGFLDVGAIATAAEAGASFRYQLLWAILLGTICVIFLVEMAGRLAAVSKHTLMDAVRERFGFKFAILPLCACVFVDFLVLAAEIGGVSLALQFVTGIRFQWWALPVAFVVWLLLWRGTFGLIENGISLLGLVTLVFVVAAIWLRPSLTELGTGFLPRLPSDNLVHYLFVAVSILGAIISPYLFYFYSSGAIESKWTRKDLPINRWVAGLGMGFGSVVSMGVLVVAALVLFPKGIRVDRYEQAALMLVEPFGHWGFLLFAAALGIACFGASLEIGLDCAYMVAQTFGWTWGEDKKPREDARFCMVYTVFIFLAALLMVIGIDPLALTLFSMALTCVVLPFVLVPFLVVMNDKDYVGVSCKNGVISNTVLTVTLVLAFLLAVVAIPLELLAS